MGEPIVLSIRIELSPAIRQKLPSDIDSIEVIDAKKDDATVQGKQLFGQKGEVTANRLRTDFYCPPAVHEKPFLRSIRMPSALNVSNRI